MESAFLHEIYTPLFQGERLAHDPQQAFPLAPATNTLGLRDTSPLRSSERTRHVDLDKVRSRDLEVLSKRDRVRIE